MDDEKRRNYGGVYVGLPADLSNVATGQTPSTHKGERQIQLYMHLHGYLKNAFAHLARQLKFKVFKCQDVLF